MSRPKQGGAAVEAASPEDQEILRNEPSVVEALAIKIGALVREHGSPELRAAALALVETVQSELQKLQTEQSHNGETPNQIR